MSTYKSIFWCFQLRTAGLLELGGEGDRRFGVHDERKLRTYLEQHVRDSAKRASFIQEAGSALETCDVSTLSRFLRPLELPSGVSRSIIHLISWFRFLDNALTALSTLNHRHVDNEPDCGDVQDPVTSGDSLLRMLLSIPGLQGEIGGVILQRLPEIDAGTSLEDSLQLQRLTLSQFRWYRMNAL